MAGKHSVSFSLLFLTAAVLFDCYAHGSDICEKADFVPVCREVVKGTTDPTAALKMSLELLLSETKRAKESSTKLGSSQFIGVCTECYDSAIDDLEKSLQYLQANDKAGLQSSLAGVSTFYVSCTDSVVEGGSGVVKVASTLVHKDTKLQQIAANTLYFASLLK